MYVGTFEYTKTRAPENLHANLGPCIGIGAIYKRKAYLLHIQAAFSDVDNMMSQLIQDLVRDVRDKTKLKIYVAGSSLDGECNDEMLKARERVLAVLSNAGFQESLTEVRWSRENSGQTLYIIPEEGTGVIEDWEDEDE